MSAEISGHLELPSPSGVRKSGPSKILTVSRLGDRPQPNWKTGSITQYEAIGALLSCPVFSTQKTRLSRLVVQRSRREEYPEEKITEGNEINIWS